MSREQSERGAFRWIMHSSGRTVVTHLDSHTATKVQQWLTARANPISPEIRLLLAQLHQFAWQIHCEGVNSILRKKSNIAAEGDTSVALFELIAQLMCPAIRTSERAIAMKSLQETLYMCTEVAPDLSPSQVGKRLESYLELSGSRGLIRVFLSVHLSNLILMDLHDSLQASTPEIFRTRMGAIERLCETAANLLVRSWAKWPKLTQSSIMSSAQLASEGMSKAINPKKRAMRRRS